MLFRRYDNSFAHRVESIQLQNIVFGIYYLPKLRLKTRANLSRHCPTADCYFQIYVSQAIASLGARDSRSTVKGTKIPAVFQQAIFNRKAAVN